MVDVNSFQSHFNKFFTPKTGFWSSTKLAKKSRYLPVLKNFESKFIENKLENNDTWSRHKIIYKNAIDKYSRKIQAPDIGRFQIDFADFTNFDDTHKYLLIIIDVFSRFLIVYPSYTRESNEYIPNLRDFIDKWNSGYYIKQNMIDIDENDYNINKYPNNNLENLEYEHPPKVYSISSDNEFPNSNEYRDLLHKYNIKMYYAMPNEKRGKVSLAERVIKTLRLLLGRYFTYNNTTQWVDVIQDFVDNYNNTQHRTIGVKPKWALVHRDKFEKPSLKSNVEYNINVGDWVRMKYYRDIFHNKSNRPYWSKEIYLVHKKVGNRFQLIRKGQLVLRPNNQPKTFEVYHLKKIKKADVSPENNPEIIPPKQPTPPPIINNDKLEIEDNDINIETEKNSEILDPNDDDVVEDPHKWGSRLRKESKPMDRYSFENAILEEKRKREQMKLQKAQKKKPLLNINLPKLVEIVPPEQESPELQSRRVSRIIALQPLHYMSYTKYQPFRTAREMLGLPKLDENDNNDDSISSALSLPKL